MTTFPILYFRNLGDNLNENSKIADIGCGTGSQTLTIAESTQVQITGIDLMPLFVDMFNEKIKKSNMQDRLNCIEGSMEELPFEPEELDLIWSEQEELLFYHCEK